MKLYGKNPVLERVKTNPKSIRHVLIEEGHLESAYICIPKSRNWRAMSTRSEGKGVRDIIRKKLDCEIMVPMKHERMSLNVAHAAAVLCWESVRQRA